VLYLVSVMMLTIMSKGLQIPFNSGDSCDFRLITMELTTLFFGNELLIVIQSVSSYLQFTYVKIIPEIPRESK
jgi:hypothetical protein